MLATKLGKGSRRLDTLEAWARFTEEGLETQAVRLGLKVRHLLVDGGDLPEDSLVASRLAGLVLNHHLMTLAELRQRFEKDLRARAWSAEGDVEALNFLWNLVDSSEQGACNRYGWDRYGDDRFAVSVIADLVSAGKLTADNADLKKALTQFPSNGNLQQWALAAGGADALTKERLVPAILAEYHRPTANQMGYSYVLKDYFRRLATKL